MPHLPEKFFYLSKIDYPKYELHEFRNQTVPHFSKSLLQPAPQFGYTV